MFRFLLFVFILAVSAPALADAPTPPPADGKPFVDNGPTGAVPTPAAPSATKELPRTDKPMEDYTKYFQQKEFIVDATPRHTLAYYLRQPKIQADQSYPLVVVLHDEKGVAQAAEYLISPDVFEAHPAYIVAPVIPLKKEWAFPPNFDSKDDINVFQRMSKVPTAIDDVLQLVADLKTNYPIDEKRVYVVGCGDGGWGAFGAIVQQPQTFAAAIPIAGGWALADAPKMRQVPLYVLHGADDKVNPAGITNNIAYWVQVNRGDVHFLAIPGLGHDCSDPRFYMKGLWTWMYQKKKGEPAAGAVRKKG